MHTMSSFWDKSKEKLQNKCECFLSVILSCYQVIIFSIAPGNITSFNLGLHEHNTWKDKEKQITVDKRKEKYKTAYTLSGWVYLAFMLGGSL